MGLWVRSFFRANYRNCAQLGFVWIETTKQKKITWTLRDPQYWLVLFGSKQLHNSGTTLYLACAVGPKWSEDWVVVWIQTTTQKKLTWPFRDSRHWLVLFGPKQLHNSRPSKESRKIAGLSNTDGFVWIQCRILAPSEENRKIAALTVCLDPDN